MVARGLNQSALARIVGVEQPSINRVLRGLTTKPRFLHDLARALETSTDYLVGQSDEPESDSVRLRDRQSGFHGATAEAAEDSVLIEHVEVRFGMGGTFLEGPVDRPKRSFPREWVRQLTDAPMGNLVWTSGVGDSMEPTIRDGDPLLADLSQNRLTRHDAIWICALGDIGMVKRLRPLPDGSVEILSDNPQVPPMHAADGELHIIARVLGKWGRL